MNGNSLLNKIYRVFVYKYGSQRQYQEYLRKQGVVIGENCEIYKDASFGSEPYLVSIGNHVRISAGVKITTHDGACWVLREKEELNDVDLFAPVKIGNNVHVGVNAIIMPGVCIGDNCVVGAGAVVTKDIPNGHICVGVPARVIRSVDEYILKNEENFFRTNRLTAQEKKRILKEKYKK